MYNVPDHNCVYNRIQQHEPLGSKLVEEIIKFKIKILILKMCSSLFYIVQLYYNARYKTHQIPEVTTCI
jgi:hypothetical protein